MSDIITFIKARLNEREARAKACLVGAPADHPRLGQWSAYLEGGDDGWAFEAGDYTGFGGIVEHEPVARHIEANDPAYVLRAVAAERKIIAETLNYMERIDGEWGDCHSAESIAAGRCEDMQPEHEEIFLAMAAVYSDHPDFDPTWALPLER